MTLDAHPGILSFALTVARLSAWLVLLAVIFLPLERWLALRERGSRGRALAQDVAYYFISGIVPGLLLALPLAVVATVAQHLVPAGMQSAIAAWPLWKRVLVGFAVGEVGFYWGHRLAHEVPFLWRFHAIHHSPDHVYFLTSGRAHPLDSVFIRLCGLVPACALGVASPLAPDGTLVPALIVLVATTWGFFIHANVRLRLGPIEALVATPAFHHWHHAKDRAAGNYASMLPVMDRIFGTYHLPADRWPVAYGIEERLPPTLWRQLVRPFRPGRTASANP